MPEEEAELVGGPCGPSGRQVALLAASVWSAQLWTADEVLEHAEAFLAWLDN